MLRWLAFLVTAGLLAGCSRNSQGVDEALPTRTEIWEAIQPQAERYAMDPSFVFALVAAESNFNPKASNGEARGLMQLKPAAWKDVASLPYEPAVWSWRTNLSTGIDYLAFCRSSLHAKGVFSYPLLLASFHYGYEFVRDRQFDLGRIPVPENAIYQKLWAGDLKPIPTP